MAGRTQQQWTTNPSPEKGEGEEISPSSAAASVLGCAYNRISRARPAAAAAAEQECTGLSPNRCRAPRVRRWLQRRS